MRFYCFIFDWGDHGCCSPVKKKGMDIFFSGAVPGNIKKYGRRWWISGLVVQNLPRLCYLCEGGLLLLACVF